MTSNKEASEKETSGQTQKGSVSEKKANAAKVLAVKDMPNLEVINKFKINEKDTGSPEVQIALITKRLEMLSGHFNKNPNDIHSQRGMFTMINRRKSLLQYLRKENIERYRGTISALGLRK